jgi:Acetyltransferase (GNAT) domain
MPARRWRLRPSAAPLARCSQPALPPVTDLPAFEIRPYRPGDEHAIVEAFNRCFAAVDPGFTPRTLESWRWQYLENPAGWRISLAVAETGEVISQYAGIPQRMRLDGQPATFTQAVDSMTDPRFRRGLKKPGFFVLTGYPFAEGYGGPPPDRDPVMWGLPVPVAWRIGKAYLQYQLIRNVNQLVLELSEGLRGLGSTTGLGLEQGDAHAGFPAGIEGLFERFAAGRLAIGLRDPAYLRWRYETRPGHAYHWLAARRAGELVGLLVWRDCAFDLQRAANVAEYLVVPGDFGVGALLLGELAQQAAARGITRLQALFPDSAPEWLEFQQRGFLVVPTRYFLVGRDYIKRCEMRWLYQHWYYSLGDTDLV